MPLRFFVLLYALSSLAQATPGGVDANGCHQALKKDFHCHTARNKGQAKSQDRRHLAASGETPAQREKRLLRECRGRPNAGACLGYAKQAADTGR